MNSISSVEELGKSADSLRTISEQVAKSTGLSSSQVSQIAFQLSGGIGTPGISPIRANASGNAGKSYSSNLTEQQQKVASELTNDQLRQFRSFADRATRDQTFASALGAESREGRELASRLSTATTRVDSAQSVFAERQAVAKRLSTAYESGEALSIDLAQLPANSDFMRRYQRLAAEYGSDSLALQAAMASELATRINAAARLSGLSYSRLMHGLKSANVELDRKVLADLAVRDAQTFASIVALAKQS